MKAFLAVVCIVVVACGELQFIAPGSATTRIGIFAQVEHDSQTRITVLATLSPGRDASGHAKEFADSALYINGTKVVPQLAGSTLQYYWTVTRPTANMAAESLRVSIPRLSLADSFVTMIGVPARLDARNLTLGPGVDLKLHMTTSAALGVPPVASQSWGLNLRVSCKNGAHLTSISSVGPYPAETRVPWEQLPSVRPQTIEACFQSNVHYGATSTPYSVDVGVALRSEWVVQLQP